jgi:Predicted membrane-bound metal-dependent hydrolases
MPTIFTHPAVALTRPWFGATVTRGAVIAAILGSILPDLDVAAFALGIPYASPYGHRGVTHSLLFAVLYALLASLALRAPRAFAFIFLCTVSHTLLDALTDGGLGVALLAPFSNERFFLPWRPIRVSPIGTRFFSARGIPTLVSELVWVWMPCVTAGLLGKYVVKRKREVRE